MQAYTPSAKHILLTLALAMSFLLSETSLARQFRLLNPIATPGKSAALPASAIPVENVQQVPRSVVEPLVRDLLAKWNSPAMGTALSEDFYDRSRLLDAVDTLVPRDATLRIQSIQGIQTIQQYIIPNPAEGRNERFSRVSATVRTQLEYNASGSLVKLSGVNEIIINIRSSVD